MTSHLTTRAGTIKFPCFLPVTTFGAKYPLDDLVRPYLSRFAQGVMVSRFYAQFMTPENRPKAPVFVDSGGFAGLFKNSKVRTENGLGVIEVHNEEDTEIIDPLSVLDFQESAADVAFTLDFPIPPGLNPEEAKRRFDLTIRNAHWALENRRRQDLPLYACIQAWDAESARAAARSYVSYDFDGIAVGGLVPRARDRKLVRSILTTVREEIPNKPIHVFGLGSPEILKEIFDLGLDSADSSSYVKKAADGELWGSDQKLDDAGPAERLQLALCNLAAACQQALPLNYSYGIGRLLSASTSRSE